MSTPIINAQMDAINGSMATLKGDLATLRPLIKTLKENALNAYATESLSNQAVASFTDGANNVPVKSLSVAITPIQNLNGQSSPYPAGGGKNKCSVDSPSFTVSYSWSSLTGTNASTVTNGTKVHLTAGTWTLSVSNKTNFTTIQVSDGSNTLLNTTASSGSFTLSAESDVYIRINTGTTGTAVSFNIQIESGSSATAWTPYSNICPISGHTEVNVYDDPKYGGTIEWNQLVQNGNFASTAGWGHVVCSLAASNNVITATRTGTGNLQCYRNIATVRGHKYLISCDMKASEAATITLRFGSNYNSKAVAANTWTNFATIKEATAATMEYNLYAASGNIAVNGTLSGRNAICIDLTQMFGSTKADEIYAMEQAQAGSGVAYFKSLFPKDYYPYNAGEQTCVSAVNGDPYTKQTISLGQTVYGGTLDVTTGVLTITWAMVDMGSLSWTYYTGATNPIFYADIADGKNGGIGVASALIISSQYRLASNECMGAPSFSTFGDFIFAQNSVASACRVLIRDTRYTDAPTFTTAMSGVQLVYELATPTTVQLTPTEVATLLGQNNIWADTGDITEVTIRCDTALYIQKLVG